MGFSLRSVRLALRGRFALFLAVTSVMTIAGATASHLAMRPVVETCSLQSGGAVQSHMLPAADSYPANLGDMVHYAADAGNLRHWQKNLVTIYVNPECAEVRRRDVTPLLMRGIELWNGKMDNVVKLVLTPEPQNADVEVTFVRPGTLAGKAIGRTDVTFRLGDQILVHANVSINEGLPSEQLVQVIAHEMGHVLGVQGHSPARADLMYPYAHLPARITIRDQNTMNLSYGKPLCKAVEDPNADASLNKTVIAAR